MSDRMWITFMPEGARFNKRTPHWVLQIPRLTAKGQILRWKAANRPVYMEESFDSLTDAIAKAKNARHHPGLAPCEIWCQYEDVYVEVADETATVEFILKYG